MGDLRAALRSGEIGIRWTPPATAEVVEEGPRLLVLRDGDAGVMWQITASSMPFALVPDDALTQDVERSARLGFDEAWSAEAGGPRRTEDPSWSPVIEHAIAPLRGGPALRLVRRITHQPGSEIVAGHLIVPTATGHVDLCALAGAETTGERETIVVEMQLALDPGAARPTQREIDEPDRDPHFPHHPLSVVRHTLDAAAPAVEVTRPAAPAAGEVVIEAASCALVPPPRFAPLAAVLGLSPSMGILTRCGVDGWRQNLDVWRYGDVPLSRFGARRELAVLARAVVERWVDDGARDIATDVKVAADFDGRPQVQQWVDMTSDRPARFLLRWWIEPDGVVYRLGVGGPRPIPDREQLALLDEAQRRWRRLDPIVRRPWWRLR